MTVRWTSEPLLTPSERADFVEEMSPDERVFALSACAGLYPTVFDSLARTVGESRAARTRARTRRRAKEPR